MEDIEITQLGKAVNGRYSKGGLDCSRSINTSQKMKSILLRQMSTNEAAAKKIVPVKEYSNKFLRESGQKQNSQSKGKNSRLNTLINKHKNFQKKYQKMLGKKTNICKTQPNQNQFQCFTTAKNFYRPEGEIIRIKTQNMIQKTQNRPSNVHLESQLREESSQVHNHLSFVQREHRSTSKYDGLPFTKKDDKISTSRALELFSRIVSKDRGDLLDKLRVCNQKKVFKDRLLESSKNLQARQVMIFEKQKKLSVVERGEGKGCLKTAIKYRHRKRSQVQRDRDDDFEIKGWDLPY